MFKYQKLEKLVLVDIGSRLILALVAVSNWDKVAWTFGEWSASSAWSAEWVAAAIEGALVIFSYMLTQRLVANSRRRKSEPEQPVAALWAVVVLVVGVSALCNSLYFVAHGNSLVLTTVLPGGYVRPGFAVVLGFSVPFLAGAIAYMTGEDAAVQAARARAEKERTERLQRRRINARMSGKDELLDTRVSTAGSIARKSNGRNCSPVDSEIDNREDAGLSKKQALDRILEAFKADSRYPVSSLAEELGRSRQTIYNYLDEMSEAGVLEKSTATRGVQVLIK